MRSLIDLLKGIRCQHHHVHIKAQARDDLLWWGVFSESWNGISTIPTSEAPAFNFCSDASGAWGCGAAWQDQWLQLKWPVSWLEVNIAAKEMVPVVLAPAVWGPVWVRSKVVVLCDNEAVMWAINRGRARDPALMRLLCCLFFITACHDFVLVASHIAGRANSLADSISRNHPIPLSFQMSQQPCPIPPELEAAILDQQADWTSDCWRQVSHFIYSASSGAFSSLSL